MLEIARAEARRRPDSASPYELRHGDLNQGVEIENASVVLLVLTLQFVRPLYRERARSARSATGSTDNGCLILVEKVLGENSTFNRLFIKHYYELKRRNGYSDLEIAQKREALENVLIPYRLEENKELLREAGLPPRGRVLQVVQLLRHDRDEVSGTREPTTRGPVAAVPGAGAADVAGSRSSARQLPLPLAERSSSRSSSSPCALASSRSRSSGASAPIGGWISRGSWSARSRARRCASW